MVMTSKITLEEPKFNLKVKDGQTEQEAWKDSLNELS